MERGRLGRGEVTAKISHSSSVPPREARTSALEAFIQNRTFLARTMVSCFSFFFCVLVSLFMDCGGGRGGFLVFFRGGAKRQHG